MRLFRTAPTARGLAVAAAIFALSVVGCSSTDDASQAGDAQSTDAATAPGSTSDTEAFGPACSALPASGPGSPAEMADQPVATAASQNPELSTLVAAVTQAGLVDTLNGAEDITVFAPTNDAFAKIPEATLAQVLADKQALTEILTYHVVDQRQAPADLDNGKLVTLQGGTITTARSGDTYTANDARVVCGNVQTGNATVYLIDAVLMPAS
jgi:uncharacterized surface protein with fasciclin (FAS1) repeats